MSTTKNKFSEEKKLLVRLPANIHRKIKLLAYDENMSMAQLCRQGLDLIIQKHLEKKNLK